MPACSAISSANVAKSLFKAAVLAFSKLISFPNNNSASNSFSIEDSKSSILLAISSTLPNSKPKDLATLTALPISSALIPSDTVVAADTLLMSFNTSFSFNATPNLVPCILAWAKISPVFDFKSPPVAFVIALTPCNSSYVKPAYLCISWKNTKLSFTVVLVMPNSEFIAIKAWPNPSAETLVDIERLAADCNSCCNLRASW